jgi:hypothetical protein
MLLKRTLIAIATMLALSGCTADPPQASGPLPVRLLHQGLHCRIDEAGVRWLATADEVSAIPGFGARVALDVDFDREGVALIAMGKRPTAGYMVVPAADRAAVEAGTVRIPVAWQEPPEGAVVAQVLTTPCLLVALPKGGYDAVAAVDQDGAVRGRVVVR